VNGFQKPIASEPKSKPRIAFVQIEGDRPTCTCGWVGKRGSRRKVLENRMESHANAQHHGQAIWR